MEKLNTRLEAIAEGLAAHPGGRALIALGSVGIETSRADEFSDLDFFAIVEAGFKAEFLQHREWLKADNEVVWIFQNTPDGFKLLWEDGIFGEMAVFELSELPEIAFAPGRIIWHHQEISPADLQPKSLRGVRNQSADPEFLKAELLTNLYVGVSRYLRGEKLSGYRFVQEHAVNAVLEIIAATNIPAAEVYPDSYNLDRRIELRFPQTVEFLESGLLGIYRTPEAAANILRWLVESGYPEDAMVLRVRELIHRCN